MYLTWFADELPMNNTIDPLCFGRISTLSRGRQLLDFEVQDVLQKSLRAQEVLAGLMGPLAMGSTTEVPDLLLHVSFAQRLASDAGEVGLPQAGPPADSWGAPCVPLWGVSESL